MARITIVGAGLLGRLFATVLSRDNTVTIIDSQELNDSKHTGRLAAAMVAPIAESAIASSNICQAGQESLLLWPELLFYLGIENAMSQHGTLVVAHQSDKQAMANFLNQISLSQSCDVEYLDSEAISRLEPEISSAFHQGHLLNHEAHIDNDLLYQRTTDLINNCNARFIKGVVNSISAASVILASQTSKETEVKHDIVLDCRGSGARKDLTSLRGVRGEVIRLHAPDVHLSRPIRLMHPRYPLYIVPKGRNEYVLGATEIESDDEKAITVRSALELLSAAYTVHTGFAEATVVAMQTGLRPAFSSNEPKISLNGSILLVNGLYRHGYLLSPYIIKLTLSLLKQKHNIENAWLPLKENTPLQSSWITYHD